MWLEEQQAGQSAVEGRVRPSVIVDELGAAGRALQAMVGSLDFSP